MIHHQNHKEVSMCLIIQIPYKIILKIFIFIINLLISKYLVSREQIDYNNTIFKYKN